MARVSSDYPSEHYILARPAKNDTVPRLHSMGGNSIVDFTYPDILQTLQTPEREYATLDRDAGAVYGSQEDTEVLGRRAAESEANERGPHDSSSLAGSSMLGGRGQLKEAEMKLLRDIELVKDGAAVFSFSVKDTTSLASPEGTTISSSPRSCMATTLSTSATSTTTKRARKRNRGSTSGARFGFRRAGRRHFASFKDTLAHDPTLLKTRPHSFPMSPVLILRVEDDDELAFKVTCQWWAMNPCQDCMDTSLSATLHPHALTADSRSAAFYLDLADPRGYAFWSHRRRSADWFREIHDDYGVSFPFKLLVLVLTAISFAARKNSVRCRCLVPALILQPSGTRLAMHALLMEAGRSVASISKLGSCRFPGLGLGIGLPERRRALSWEDVVQGIYYRSRGRWPEDLCLAPRWHSGYAIG
uniref:Uncharacterized protein n=1 Tax=Mycena chlorophos TaxID=658473 RepID=A0ABQ0LV80_MYCCL|nr:predicted protein [Mycena chlorophos]